jgi:WD40 repeat protein
MANQLTEENKQALEFYYEAFRLSAHILLRDPAQLTGQMVGRLGGTENPIITDLVQDGMQRKNTPWLRPLISSLAPPGGPLIRTLAGHSDQVEAICIDRVGRVAASVSRDKTLRLWDLESGDTQSVMQTKGDEWNAVALSPDGSRAVCQSSSVIGISLEVWDLTHERPVGFLKTFDDATDLLSGKPQLAFLPDGHHLVATANQYMELWDLDQKELVCSHEAHSQAIYALAVAQSSMLVATGAENEIKVWSLDPSHVPENQIIMEKHTLTSKAGGKRGGWTSNATPIAITFFEDDCKILVAFGNNILEIWDVSTGTLVNSWPGPGDEFLSSKDAIKTIAISGDNAMAILGIGDGRILVQDIHSGTDLHTLAAHDEAVVSLAAFRQKAGFLSAGWDGILKYWDLTRLEAEQNAGTNAKLEEKSGREIQGLAVSTNGHLLLSTGKDRLLRIWDPRQASLQYTLPIHTGELHAVIGPYHLPQIVGGFTSEVSAVEESDWTIEENSVRLCAHPRVLVWDVTSGQVVSTLFGSPGWVKSLSFSSHSDRLLSLTQNHKMRLWDLNIGQVLPDQPWEDLDIIAISCLDHSYQAVVATRENQLFILDLENGVRRDVGEGHTSAIQAISVYQTDQRAITASRDNTLMVWDLLCGGIIARLEGHRDEIESVSVSHNESYAASGSADENIILWDMKSFLPVCTLKGHTGRVRTLSFLPDGRLASGGLDGTVRIWDIYSGRMLARFKVASDWVESLAYSPTTGILFAGSPDSTIRAWDMRNYAFRAILTCDPFSRVTAMAAHPDGNHLVSADGDPTLTSWRLPDRRGLTVLQTEWPELNPVMAISQEVAIYAHAEPALQVLNLTSGKIQHTLSGHVHRISAIAMTSDGSCGITGSETGELIVWNLLSGHAIHHLDYHTDRIYQIMVVPDNITCLTRSWKSLAAWNLHTGQILWDFPTDGNNLSGLTISPSGYQAAVGMDVSYNKQLVIWDLRSGEHKLIGPPIRGFFNDLKWLADDQLLVLIGGAQIRVFNTKTGEIDRQWQAGDCNPVRAALVPDSPYLVTHGWEPTVQVWNTLQGKLLCAFTIDSDLTACVLTSDGKILVAGDKVGKVHFFQLENFNGV